MSATWTCAAVPCTKNVPPYRSCSNLILHCTLVSTAEGYGMAFLDSQGIFICHTPEMSSAMAGLMLSTAMSATDPTAYLAQGVHTLSRLRRLWQGI